METIFAMTFTFNSGGEKSAASTAVEIAEIVKALASLAWPVAAIICLFLFRRDISRFFRRLKKAQFGGSHLELAEELLDEATENQVQLEISERALPQKDKEHNGKTPYQDLVTEEIAMLSGTSPKAALMRLAAEIERETREIIDCLTPGDIQRPRPLRELLFQAEKLGVLPSHLSTTVQRFNLMRNSLVHGVNVEPEAVSTLIDAGLIIYRTLRSFPRQIVTVMYEPFPVYRDAACTQLFEGVRGIMLDIRAVGSLEVQQFQFPVSQEGYTKGMRVSWDWEERVVGEAWFIHPETGEKLSAWHSSMFFAGKPLLAPIPKT